MIRETRHITHVFSSLFFFLFLLNCFGYFRIGAAIRTRQEIPTCGIFNFCFRVNLWKFVFEGPSVGKCMSNMRPSQILTLARIYYEYNNGQWRMCAFLAEKITSIYTVGSHYHNVGLINKEKRK